MGLISYSEAIDYTLLNQYRDMLGTDGISQSLQTLETLIPSYLSELAALGEAEDEPAFRRQAHKVKGACRSLGFARLGDAMQYLEREHWTWADANAVQTECHAWLKADLDEVKRWLSTAT